MTQLVILFVATLFGGGGFIYFQYNRTKDEARAVYDARLKRDEVKPSEPYAPFERAHLVTSGLRVSLYRLVAGITAIISVPLSVGVVSFLWARVYFLLERPAAMTEGELVHSFFLVLTTMGTLVTVAWVFVRRYYKNSVGTFEEEWAKEKERFSDNMQQTISKTGVAT